MAEAETTPAAAPVAKKSNVKYESNPFLVSISGIITMLKVNPVPSLLLGIILMLIVVGGLFVSIFIALVPIIGWLIFLAVLLLIFPFIMGAYHSLAISSMRGETRKTEEYINAAFKKLWPALGASVLIGLSVFVGFLFFIIPGIILAAWFALTYFVMFDEDLGAVASMKRSKQLVSGHVFEILGAYLAGGLMSGGSLGGGAGLLTPVISIAPMAGRYEQLKALKAADAPKPDLHWMNVVLVIVYGLVVTSIVIFYTFIAAFSLFNSDLRNELRNGSSSDSFESSLERELKELEERSNNRDYDYDYDYNFDSPTYTN